MIYSKIEILKEKLPLIPNDSNYKQFKDEIKKVTNKLEHKLKSNYTSAVIFERNEKCDVKLLDALIKDRISDKFEQNISYVVKGYKEIPNAELIDGEIKVPMDKWNQLKESVFYVSEEDYLSAMERWWANVDPDVSILVVNHVNEFNDDRICKFLDKYSTYFADGNLITVLNNAPSTQCNSVKSCDLCYPTARRQYLLQHHVHENRLFKISAQDRLQDNNEWQECTKKSNYEIKNNEDFDTFLEILRYELSVKAKEKRMLKESSTIESLLNNAENILKFDKSIQNNLKDNGTLLENKKEIFEQRVEDITNGEIAENIEKSRSEKNSDAEVKYKEAEEEVCTVLTININIIIKNIEAEIKNTIPDADFGNFVIDLFYKEYLNIKDLIRNLIQHFKETIKSLVVTVKTIFDNIWNYMKSAGKTIKDTVSNFCSKIKENLLNKFNALKNSVIELAGMSTNNFKDNLNVVAKDYKENLKRLSNVEENTIKRFINSNENKKFKKCPKNCLFTDTYMNDCLNIVKKNYQKLNQDTQVKIDNLYKKQGNHGYLDPLKQNIYSILSKSFNKDDRYCDLFSNLQNEKCYTTLEEEVEITKIAFDELDYKEWKYKNFYTGWCAGAESRTWYGRLGSGLYGAFYGAIPITANERQLQTYTKIKYNDMINLVDSYFPLFRQDDLDEMIKCIENFWSRFNFT